MNECEFAHWKIGDPVLVDDAATFGIFRVSAHLVGKWFGTQRPWITLALESVCGVNRFRVGDKRYGELKNLVVAGSLPSHELLSLVVLNGNKTFSR